MGITERHWFEDEEPELTERQLVDAVAERDIFYKQGYTKGYLDGAKEQGEQIKNRDESLEKAREEIKWLRGMLKEQGWNLLTEDDDGIIHGLPGDDGQYLMTDGRDIWIDDYMDGVDDGIFLDSGRYIREIKAWMYMPKLPQEGR